MTGNDADHARADEEPDMDEPTTGDGRVWLLAAGWPVRLDAESRVGTP